MRIVVGMSGATGAIYGIRLLEVLSTIPDIETHLVLSDPAKLTIGLETKWSVPEVEAMATHLHNVADIGASISSGSFKTAGMIIAPCSIRTLSGVANSLNANLLVRAADVTLKERRKLVMMVRETPLHLGHLRLMQQVTEMGGILVPPMPAFYHLPRTIDDIVNQIVGKALDQFDIDHRLFTRWGSEIPTQADLA